MKPIPFAALLLLVVFPMLSPADSRPNFVIVLVDDMGYSDLGCYGSEIETPHLDALAAEGIRYTQMYNTSKCWTTRISLLTGLYHQRSDRAFARTALVGEVLRPAGYRTWWSGKHHADFNPHERGFDHFSGFLGGAINSWNPSAVAREGEPVPGRPSSYSWAFDDRVIRPFVPDKDFYATDRFTDWALGWLEEDRGGAPFFLYLAYNAPHWPLHAHARDIEKVSGRYDAGYEAIRRDRYRRQIQSGLFDPEVAPLSPAEHEAWDSLTESERADEARRMEIHAAMVASIDENIGRLVAALQRQGVWENTLFLFLVDNGASHERPRNRGKSDSDAPWGTVGSFEAIGKNWANVANTPFRRWKINPEEGGINTPMIAHWPDGITASTGTVCREPCHVIDLLPTWMELAGAAGEYPGESTEQPAAVDGISLTPTFRGAALSRPTPLFFEYQGKKVVRDGSWKAIQVKRQKSWQLFDLSTDRTELRDVSADHPDRVAAMAAQWTGWYEGCQQP